MSLSLTLWAQLYAYPFLVTLAIWGGLTMILVWLNKCGAKATRWALVLFVPFLFIIHHQLWLVRNDTSIWGSYIAFAAGTLIWAWHELGFYSGILTGPWRAPCPPGVSGWRRFGYALATHLYHEAAVLVELGLLWWVHHDAANLVGVITFISMWALQHSAKLNVLLGVRYLQVSLFPQHLRYLGSFWKQRPHNPFFLASVLTSSLLAIELWIRAGVLAPDGSAVGITLLASVMTLGTLEHWLLMLPAGFWQQLPINKPSKSENPRLEPDA